MSDRLKELKREMILCYGLKCWLNELWIPQKRDMITYHHILERRNNGHTTWENGALLGRSSHDYLNFLDNQYHNIYKELNGAFIDLNRTYAPPTEDYYDEIEHILRKVNKYDNYKNKQKK